MSTQRLEILKSMVAQKPEDSFARYGLAMEYANSGDLKQAVTAFGELIDMNPNYAAAYYHGGQASEKLGDLDRAREFYRSGLEATKRIGDGHTMSEIQVALDLLG